MAARSPVRPLAQRWNGTSWAAQTVPNPSGASFTRLTGVNCASDTSCVGVGTYLNSAEREVPMAQRWNGSSWSVEAAPAPTAAHSHLDAVSCPAGATCMAVGHAVRAVSVPLVERYG